MLLVQAVAFLAALAGSEASLFNIFDIGSSLLPKFFKSPAQTDITCPRDLVSCTRVGVDSCCSPSYGVVVLALQWDLNMGPDQEFTIHGLWPNKCDGSFGPKNGCDPSRKLSDVSDVIYSSDRTIYDQAKKYWPSNRGDDNYFWTHEWNKHGTCVSTLNPKCYNQDSFKKGQDVVDYFSTTLKLAKRFNLYKALEAHGIVPTDPNSSKNLYTPQQFKSAIKAEFGVEANLRCVGNRLNEIFLYFNVRNKDDYFLVPPVGKDSCRKISYRKRTRRS
ncbi:Ribonuclease Rh [Smittium mucronatum]|uniref:ribonuclease T2 n=1 Tax=Smittium mucronatum TaxID=133383 RepID=A0A1R0GUK1_9FUNG|nr:Ribonuclease Rh [Smittium mucronatum]